LPSRRARRSGPFRPRRRCPASGRSPSHYDPLIPLYVWISLLVLVAAAGAGIAFAVVRGLAAWRALRSLRRAIGRQLAELEQRVAGIEDRVEQAGGTAARLGEAQARLQESLAAAAILADAFGEARALTAALRGGLPSK
jgi:hypothetical protein